MISSQTGNQIKKQRVLFFLTMLFIAIVSAVLLWGVYLVAYPYKTAKITPATITNAPIPAGSIVKYESTQCRYTDKTATVIRTLVNPDFDINGRAAPKIFVPLGSNDSSAPVGCYTIKPPEFIIPSETPPGTYKIYFQITFHINALRNIPVRTSSRNFEVIAPVK